MTLRSTTVRNRLVVPAMVTHFGDTDGRVSDSLCDYLEERARGGFGIVVTENLGVHASGRIVPRMVMVDDDRCVPGLSRVANAIKRHGAVAIGQINHCGRQNKSKVTGQPLLAPSAIPCPVMREMPRALERDEILMLQDAYADAAVRLQEAGFDGTEIHAAHGYLAASFLSAYSNRREDEYGGNLENRLRFLAGIVDRIRSRTDDNFLLFVRTSVEEFVPGGIDTEQTKFIGRALASRGVDVLSLSVGVYESYAQLTMVSGEPEGPWLRRMAQVRAEVPVPVVGVGRIRRLEVAQDAIASGQVDFVAIGRGSITNPYLARLLPKTPSGVVSCMSCNICLGRSAAPGMTCPVNPFVGRERLLSGMKSAASGTIDILGGGFAALTAAWLAAKRGAKVQLVADAGELGGMQSWRSRVPGQAEYRTTCIALVQRAAQEGVRFVLPDEYSASACADLVWKVQRWEPVARPENPQVPAYTSYEVLRGNPRGMPGRLLVVADDLSGVDAALLLADQGHSVTLRSPARDIAVDAHPGFRVLNRGLLERRGAKIETGVASETLLDTKGFDALVVGRLYPTDERAPDDWVCDFAVVAQAHLDDAYEPGVLTRCVYSAVELAWMNSIETADQAGGRK